MQTSGSGSAAGAVKNRTWPSTLMPTGWFQIGWSGEFPAMEAVRVSCFDRELVAYRGESGVVHVLDGFCRHLGAHLGIGGRVEGESIRCPFHGWVYGSDGCNVEIPYSTPEKMGRLRLGNWHAREVDGLVLIHHAREESQPETDPGTFAPRHLETFPVEGLSTRIWRDAPMVPQMAAENVVDAPHFKYVHRNATIGELTLLDTTGPVFRTQVDARQGESGTGITWATPTGPVDTRIVLEARGLGLLWNVQYGFDEITSLLAVTPTSPTTTDLRATIWIPRRRGDGSSMEDGIRDKWIRFMHGQIESDLRIWSHQTYVASAPLAHAESGPVRAFRDWSATFYSDER